MNKLFYVLVSFLISTQVVAETYDFTVRYPASPTLGVTYKIYGGDVGQTEMLGETDLLILSGTIELQATMSEFFIQTCTPTACVETFHLFKQRTVIPEAVNSITVGLQ